MRSNDTIYRYGGEEFAALLPETSAVGAAETADRLRNAVEERFGRATSVGPITISGGVACFPEHVDSATTLVECADRALYPAKERGRNRVVVAEPAMPMSHQAVVSS